jgi:23S rRNA pseudouridine2605 synthase
MQLLRKITQVYNKKYNYNFKIIQTMTTGDYDNGQNRERRPYNSIRINRDGRQDNRGGYNRPSSGNYRREDGNDYNSSRPRPNYNSESSYGNYERPQRSYDNSSREFQGDGEVKRKRPRVGDPIGRNTGNYNSERSNTSYNRENREGSGTYQRRPQGSGSYQQRPGGGNPRGNNKFNKGGKSGAYNPNSKYSVQKQLKYREENFDPNEPIRLNKYLANAGVCSRREADEFIQAGLVKVNGVVVAEVGTKVKRSDVVMFHDEPVKLEHKIYLLLNKPKNCVTTADDPQERLTVMDLVKTACHERIFPVGRLDRNTTGVLLLTNDGDLASKLTHPKFLKKKIYHVWLDKDVDVADMQKLAEGIELEDGEIHADAISYVSDEAKDQVGIEIHSGRNRIVRRMFESLGYHVRKLDRVYFAGLTKKNLKKGQWRFLTEKEVSMLRMGAFE